MAKGKLSLGEMIDAENLRLYGTKTPGMGDKMIMTPRGSGKSTLTAIPASSDIRDSWGSVITGVVYDDIASGHHETFKKEILGTPIGSSTASTGTVGRASEKDVADAIRRVAAAKVSDLPLASKDDWGDAMKSMLDSAWPADNLTSAPRQHGKSTFQQKWREAAKDLPSQSHPLFGTW